MNDELRDLLDAAIYKEIASEALYLAAQDMTADAGARQLLTELAQEEKKHSRWIAAFKERPAAKAWRKGAVADLKISEHLTGPEHLDGVGLQDALIFAIKREQQSIDFYSRMMAAVRTPAAKRLCQRLAGEELRHKLKLEVFYDDLFLGED